MTALKMTTKKTVITIALTLVGLHLAFSALNIGSEYTAERLLHHTLNAYYTMPPSPDETLLGDQTFVKEKLRRIITRFPDSSSAQQAYLNLATFCLETKDYDEAIKVSEEILEHYKKNIYISAEAVLIKAVSYEKLGKTGVALKEFKILRDKYIKTKAGLKAPLYMAQFYEKAEDMEKAEKHYAEALTLYKDISEEDKGEMMGYMASLYLIRSYMAKGLYEEAGRVVEDVIASYPEAVIPEQLPFIELIYVKQLNMPQKAKGMYEWVLNKVTDPGLKRTIYKKIKMLRQLSESRE